MTARRTSRRAVDALTQALKVLDTDELRRACDAVRTVPLPELIEAAEYHRVGGALYPSLQTCADLPAEYIAPFRSIYQTAVLQHMRGIAGLRHLAPILDASGSRWAVIKGPALVEAVYGDPGSRPYADLDIVVEPGGFDRVLRRLADEGLHPLDRNWRHIRRSMLGELHFVLPSGLPVDLHWHLVNMYRGPIRIDAAELLERSNRIDVGGTLVPVLEPSDALLHLAIHGTLSGGDRLLWIVDVARSAQVQPPDWSELTTRARRWRVAPPVGLMLERARVHLDAPIPTPVSRALLGRRYRAANRLVQRVSPWQTARGRLTVPSLVLARSMALGFRGAAWWLASRTVAALDPREPARSSNFRAAGSAADFQAYVQAVVASASGPRE